MKKLIVNADDFGWSEGINKGIIDCHKNGIVTSTSLLATGQAYDHAVYLAKANPTLSVGVHLNFYRGTPLLETSDVLYGSIPKLVAYLMIGKVKTSQIEAEFRAQIDKIILSGIRPTHLDSEKHVHLLSPKVYKIVKKLSSEYGIKQVRVVKEPLLGSWKSFVLGLNSSYNTEVGSCGVAYSPTSYVGLERVLRQASRSEQAEVELITHPGYLDEEFWQLQATIPNKLTYAREEEAKILQSERARKLVSKYNFELTSFGVKNI